MVNEIIYTLGPCCCSYHYTVYRHNIVGLKLILLLNFVLDLSAISVMGGRKFCLNSKHRKNEEQKKGRSSNHGPAPAILLVSLPRQITPHFTIFLSLATYIDSHVQSSESLCTRLSSSLCLLLG